MALQLELTRASGRPLYRQIAEQIKTRIQDGRLADGVRLPTVRDLAQTLQVSALTVHNAYTELQLQGFIESIVGSGTFVSSAVSSKGLADTLWRRQSLDSLLSDLQTVMYAPDLRPLATAGADPEFFPTEAFWTTTMRLNRDGAGLYLYAAPTGDARLRNEIASLAEDRGIQIGPDDLIVTNGATRALSLITHILTKPGDKVLVEEYTYIGFLCILEAYGVQAIPVPTDEQGVRVDEMRRLVAEHKPKFFFTIPNFSNPTGILMSDKRRKELLDLASQVDLYIVEDDAFGRLAYDGPAPASLKSLDADDRVIYVDSFCKTLFPGLRIGYLVPPRRLFRDLAAVIRSLDISGSTMTQRALARFLEEGAFRAHIKRVIPKYRERRDTMMRALQDSMPSVAKWTKPQGGFTCWLTLPNEPSLQDLYSACLSRGVAIAPGELFSGTRNGHLNLRLAFSMVNSDEISEAVHVIGDLVRARL